MIKFSELITLHKFRFAIILIKSWQSVVRVGSTVKFIHTRFGPLDTSTVWCLGHCVMSSPRHFIVLYFPVCFSLCLKIVSDWYANCIYFDVEQDLRIWSRNQVNQQKTNPSLSFIALNNWILTSWLFLKYLMEYNTSTVKLELFGVQEIWWDKWSKSCCLGLSVFVFVSIIIILSPAIDEFIPG